MSDLIQQARVAAFDALWKRADESTQFEAKTLAELSRQAPIAADAAIRAILEGLRAADFGDRVDAWAVMYLAALDDDENALRLLAELDGQS